MGIERLGQKEATHLGYEGKQVSDGTPPNEDFSINLKSC
jgi:hypothetical protein